MESDRGGAAVALMGRRKGDRAVCGGRGGGVRVNRLGVGMGVAAFRSTYN